MLRQVCILDDDVGSKLSDEIGVKVSVERLSRDAKGVGDLPILQCLLKVIRSSTVIDNGTTCEEEQPVVRCSKLRGIGQMISANDLVKELHGCVSDTDDRD